MKRILQATWEAVTQRGLQLRLVLFVFLPVLAAMLGLGLAILSHAEEQGERRMQEDVQLIARALESPLARALEKDRQGTVQQALQSADSIGRVYGVSVYDTNGYVIATEGEGNLLLDGDLQSDVAQIIRRGEPIGQYNRISGRSVYSYFVPLKDSGGGHLALLQVTRRRSDFREYLQEIRSGAAIYLLSGAAIISAIAFVGYYNAIGKWLGQLRRSMAWVERGNLHHRASCGGPTEIRTVARALNQMLDSIETAQREIEQRRQTEAALERQLKQSEKLAAAGRVAGAVAHELGTPLSLIDGNAQKLWRRLNGEKPVEPRLVGQIREEVRRMERLIRQLIELGRPGSRHRKRTTAVQLANMARQTVSGFSEDQGTAIELKGPRPGPPLEVDPFRVELALSNLLQNAIQASPGNRVDLCWAETEGSVTFEVHDSGPGIPPDKEGLIFDPFFTTKKGSKGRGLGLSVVHQVVDEHDGRIQLGRSPLGGALFQISFPKRERVAKGPQ